MIDPHFWWYLARASGLVAWALLSITVVWGLLLHSGLLGRWLPWAWTASVHRFLGVLSVLFTGLHLTGLVLDSYVQIGLPELLVPLASDWRPLPVALGVVALYLLVAVLGTSLLATRLPRRWWKRVHLLSYLLFWTATMHLITAGTDAGYGALRAVVVGTVLVVLLLTVARVVGIPRSAHAATRTKPGTPALRAAEPAFHPLRVAEVRRETPDAVSVRFAVPPDLMGSFRFRPGQHVRLRAHIDDAQVSRPYSICSGIADGELRIAVRHLPDGGMSSWINTALRAGDVVDVAAPAGTFGTDVGGPVPRHVLALASGSGSTPVMSIVSSVLATEPASRCTLVYGNRTAASTLLATRIHELQEWYPGRLHVVHLRSQEAARLPILSGRLDRAALCRLADRGDLNGVDEAYVCGPGAMITDIRQGLVDDLGLPPDRVHAERFTAALPTPMTGEAFDEGTVHIRHSGVEHRVPVAAGESVLDAGLRAGLDLPYFCRAGVCGSCVATVCSDKGEQSVPTCQLGAAPGSTVDFDAPTGDRRAKAARPAVRT